MSNNSNYTLIKTLFAGLSSRLFVAYTSLENLKTSESLSPAGMLQVKTISLCHRHMNHICRLVDYLTTPSSDSIKKNYYDSEELLSGITEAFSKTVSDYLPVSANFSSKLKSPHLVNINKNKFETVFLNILYSCLKAADLSGNRRTKLALSISETKTNITFRIRSNSNSPAPEIIEMILSDSYVDATDLLSQDAILALSLKIASLYVEEFNGSLTYTTTKNGSTYNLSIPKAPAEASSKLHSALTYVPTYKHFDETFAEFILESILD